MTVNVEGEFVVLKISWPSYRFITLLSVSFALINAEYAVAVPVLKMPPRPIAGFDAVNLSSRG